MSKKKSDWERILDAVTATDGMREEEIKAELAEHGVDLAGATARLDAHLEAQLAKANLKKLDDAKTAREQWSPSLTLEQVRGWMLPTKELVSRIRGLEGAFAHREVGEWSREDLESHLFDLLVLQEREESGE